ncbi:glycosyltransferase family 2 protein [Candidatus Chloroploca sp. M-50]|uniref:Glycosyltransferase family 2 protein n=1 Tax=Candidatus Chloroploca mongolica TaxID=2528176 RepID=A0ABS4D5P1_9CHLR|nr:glycosyltransferase family 2 protein [Candidatus Chloroploca mongolica]MBP1464739.1 glycosyltransferase family 2 protein [Candidatus Chloroploca mongolica]
MFQLSIIIVNWNTRSLLHALLTTLVPYLQQDRAEIIVVDNASDDGSGAMVAADFPQVTLIQNAQNVGFARANNQALALAQGRYLLLLNTDTLVPPGALAGLLHFMATNPEVGACSPRLLTAEGQPQAFAFGDDPTPAYLLRRGLWRLLLKRPLHDWGVAQVLEVAWVAGTCLMLRRETLARVKGFDEAFFMYFEDVDLCRRIRHDGWKICYVPTIAITHLGGQSLQQNPAAQDAYYESLRSFYGRHYPPSFRLWLVIGLLIYQRLKALQ